LPYPFHAPTDSSPDYATPAFSAPTQQSAITFLGANIQSLHLVCLFQLRVIQFDALFGGVGGRIGRVGWFQAF